MFDEILNKHVRIRHSTVPIRPPTQLAFKVP